MSVPKYKRNISKMEFYHTARDIQRRVNDFLLRDFGVRDKARVEVCVQKEIYEKRFGGA